jgi:sulfur relay (sulfurtransferase) DsrC/TusE family protein
MRRFSKRQIKTGTKIESEHKSTLKFIKSYFRKHSSLPSNSMIYKKIAIDHLNENPKYYGLAY